MIRRKGLLYFVGRVARILLRPVRVLRDEGPRSVAARIAGRAYSRLTINTPTMLVRLDDVAEVDWTVPRVREPVAQVTGPAEIAWIMSPPGKESGGHQNLFRFIRYAEQAGHRCSIYFYSSRDDFVSIADVRAMLRTTDAYAEVAAPMTVYDRTKGVAARTDAIVATGWETAYPAYLDTSAAKRFYFVQDYEPHFYAVGSESLLAENTYRFGFHGLTAGRWLAERLKNDYGMPTDHFDFAVDKSIYHVTNTAPRNELFFYARPVTPRRAFEFGLIALADFAALRPDVKITLAGWDVSNWKIPFEYENLASLEISELNAVYNRCRAGLVLSLTNMSLLPLELIASGVVPIVNDGPNNRLVSSNPHIEYVEASPPAIARRLAEVFERGHTPTSAQALSDSVEQVNWDESGRQFIEALERGLRA